jgi:hypothetical protein
MNTSRAKIGTKTDHYLRDSALFASISPLNLQTVRDVLEALDGDPHLAMLRTTAGLLSASLNVPVERLKIDVLVDVVAPFKAYLKGRRYKQNAVRSYSNYAGMLLRRAKKLGWTPQSPEVPEPWKPILAAAGKEKGCAGVVRYAIRKGKPPLEFTDDDLSAWGMMMLNLKRSHWYVQRVKRNFRRLLSECRFAQQFPGISFRSGDPKYAIPLRSFPPQLRAEVEALLKWKQDVFVPGRPQKARVRAISAKELEGVITQLYGYMIKAEPRNRVSSLLELVTEKWVNGFIAWLLNERKIQGESLIPRLGRLRAAMKHPMYKTRDFGWLSALLLTIPQSSESERLERKVRKYLPYDVLAEIPKKIRDGSQDFSKLNPVQLALLVHDELLIKWLVTLLGARETQDEPASTVLAISFSER